MRQSTKQKLIRAADRRSGIFTAQDVERENLSPRTLYRLRDAGEIVCISRGVFQLADVDDREMATPDYAAIKKRVPDGVACLISALYHHGLTTEIPRKIHLAVHRDAHIPRIDYPLVRIFRMSPIPFSIGVEQMEIGGVKMNIFSPEKTIVDCFKYRDKFGLDLAIEGLKNYLSRRAAHPTAVLEIAKLCRVETIIKPYLEALV
jgi:predicted transcriptional regulator of viral defense system